MNSDPEEFETLRKLMALKRHEQPPPGYLRQLSTSIRTRIEHGEGQMNLWDRLSASISLRSSLAYSIGLTVCGALGLSAVYMVKQEMMLSADSSPGVILKASIPAGAFASQFNPSSTPPLHVANWLRNTNPSAEFQPESSLFNTSHAAIPVSYELGN
jgi:hypothetical protein